MFSSASAHGTVTRAIFCTRPNRAVFHCVRRADRPGHWQQPPKAPLAAGSQQRLYLFRSVRRAGLYRRGDLYGPFCRTDHSGRYHRPELAGLFWYDAGYWHYVANCLAGHDPHCGGHQCGPNTGISLPFFSSGGTSLLILLCEMGIILSISRAGNAQNAARSKRSHEELARRMNPQRRTHKALHSN